MHECACAVCVGCGGDAGNVEDGSGKAEALSLLAGALLSAGQVCACVGLRDWLLPLVRVGMDSMKWFVSS